MIPTILVARIAVTDTNEADTSGKFTHISGLQFGSQRGTTSLGQNASANGTRGLDDTSLVHIEEIKPSSDVELKKEYNKVENFGDNHV